MIERIELEFLDLAEPHLDTDKPVDDAIKLEYFKFQTQSNIDILEAHVTKEEEELFSRFHELRPSNNPHRKPIYYEKDPEAFELGKRADDLSRIYEKKVVVRAFGKIFGHEDLEDFDREDLRRLVDLAVEYSELLQR